MNTTNHRNPVLLVHGIIRTSRVFRRMSTYLTKRGWSVHTLNLKPNDGTVSLDQLATQVADYVDKTFSSRQPIDLVGLSMGGLVTRYYLQRLGGIERVQRFISISAPNHGTWLAHLSARPGCVQMRPGSQFLEDLNRDSSMLKKLNFTYIWTPWDFVIVPARSSQMPVGREIKVQVFAHAWMVRASQTMRVLASALSEQIEESSKAQE
ncbi:MAG: alpha/beta fold hydrolase [Symploca sp. SIO2E9]|nr:alpha/beta fold hydrolase [Symploca sp. SIO2E9]